VRRVRLSRTFATGRTELMIVFHFIWGATETRNR